MKKKLLSLLSLAISIQLVFALGVTADDTTSTDIKDIETGTETDTPEGDSDSGDDGDSEEGKGKGKDKKANENARKGLENALERVKGTPAEKVISDLLDLEGEDLEDEDVEVIEEELEDVLEEVADEEVLKEVADAVYTKVKSNEKELKQQALLLKKVVDIYEKAGSVGQAVKAQKDVLTSDAKDLQAYKRLGALYKKLGEEQVRVYINGQELISDVAPVIENGTTLVPVAAISVVLGAEVLWNEEERSVTLTREDVVVKLVLGSKTAYINGEAVELRQAPKALNGRTILPAKFISETFGSVVEWEPDSKSVVIVEEGKELEQETEVEQEADATTEDISSESDTSTEESVQQ